MTVNWRLGRIIAELQFQGLICKPNAGVPGFSYTVLSDDFTGVGGKFKRAIVTFRCLKFLWQIQELERLQGHCSWLNSLHSGQKLDMFIRYIWGFTHAAFWTIVTDCWTLFTPGESWTCLFVISGALHIQLFEPSLTEGLLLLTGRDVKVPFTVTKPVQAHGDLARSWTFSLMVRTNHRNPNQL